MGWCYENVRKDKTKNIWNHDRRRWLRRWRTFEEDEKLKMFIENPIGTIARIIGLGSLEDDYDLDYGDDENDLLDPSNFDSDYITKQELINRNNNNSKIIKYDFKIKIIFQNLI